MNTKLVVRIICIILVALMVLSLLPAVFADNGGSDNQDERIADIENRISQASSGFSTAEEKLEMLKNEQSLAIDEKIALEERNIAASEELSLIEEEIALYDVLIDEKAGEVTRAQEKEESQFDMYRTRIRAMEENGGYNILALFLNVDSFTDFLSAIDDYKAVMQSDKTMYDNYMDARIELEKTKEEYEDYQSECESKKIELQAEQTELQTKIEDSEQYLLLLALAIEETEEERLAAQMRFNTSGDSLSGMISEYLASGGSISDIVGSGNWTWPFGNSNRVSSTMKDRWGTTHNGIDIDGFSLEGSSISAADAGTVVTAGYNGGYGNYVIIDHGNGYQTLYAHLDSLGVSAGETVGNGQSIGVVGSTGSATGTHLHYEIFQNGTRIDPLSLYGGYELEAGADIPS